jgi:NDP-sugar pyrophosphorylase family protein
MVDRSTKPRVAGVMAAGRGHRLRTMGSSKPLVVVRGRPLIDWVFDQLADAQVSRVVVAAQPDDGSLTAHVLAEKRFPAGVEVVSVEGGAGTGSAVRAILEASGNGPCLISTVDTIAPRGSVLRLLECAEEYDPEPLAVVLATSFVHDPEPIWISTQDGVHVTRFAKFVPATGLVFANVRWFSAAARRAIEELPRSVPERDSVLMTHLITNRWNGVVVHQEEPVFDIDEPSDVEVAEQWLGQGSPLGDWRLAR